MLETMNNENERIAGGSPRTHIMCAGTVDHCIVGNGGEGGQSVEHRGWVTPTTGGGNYRSLIYRK